MSDDEPTEWVLPELIETDDFIWRPDGVDSGTVEGVQEDVDGYFFLLPDPAPSVRVARDERVRRRVREW